MPTYETALPRGDDLRPSSTDPGSGQSITDDDPVKTALRDSEARYRNLFDESPLSIWEADWSGVKKIVDRLIAANVGDIEPHLNRHPELLKEAIASIRVINFNNATVQIYRARSRAALEQRMQEFLAATYWDDIANVIASLAKGVARHDLVCRERALDGSELLVRVIRRIPEGYEDSWERVIEIVEDITESKAAEEALRRSEALIRDLINHSPSAIVLKDRQGRFVLTNRRLEEWLATPASETLGKTTYDFLPEENAAAHAALDEIVLNSGRSITREVEVPLPDGSVRSFLMNKFPVNGASGTPDGVGTIATDVTELRQTEALLRHALKMEAIGQLTGGIAHDFNNLLAVILGNLELMEEFAKGNADVETLIGPAVHAARRGAELTSHLLSFARQQPLAPKVVDIAAQIDEMTDVLSRTLGGSITIGAEIADDLWPVLVDPQQMEMALINLAVNARDAMPLGGRVTIEATNACLTDGTCPLPNGLRTGSYVRLAVHDTGTGMAAAVVEQAFEPFFSTKPVGKGSGLGLSMVYGFCKQSRGHCEIKSQEGVGTSIFLYLPRALDGEVTHDALEDEQPRWQAANERILVVEDDREVRFSIARQVESLGYRAVQAADGASALTILEMLPGIDLMLTDIVLPGDLNGVELAREGRRRKPGLPVIYISGYAEDDIAEIIRAELPDEVLSKPFGRAQLGERIFACLRRRCA